jgi:hypothetical protein
MRYKLIAASSRIGKINESPVWENVGTRKDVIAELNFREVFPGWALALFVSCAFEGDGQLNEASR